jgi:hypothetical protein
MLERTGVRARVESELAALVSQAKTHLIGAPLSPEGVRQLGELADLFGGRES